MGHFCGANSFRYIGIHDQGRLNKCRKDSDKPEHSFGTAAKRNPKDPLNSADHPDLLTRYLNTSSALDDPECRKCLFLPVCGGGCPRQRLFRKHTCIACKDIPEAFALKVYEAKKKRE